MQKQLISEEELFLLSQYFSVVNHKDGDDLPILIRTLRQIRHSRKLLTEQENLEFYENLDLAVSAAIKLAIAMNK